MQIETKNHYANTKTVLIYRPRRDNIEPSKRNLPKWCDDNPLPGKE